MNRKTIYKVAGIGALTLGLFFITLGMINMFQVINHNANLPNNVDPLSFKMIYSIISAPLMFGGFFFIVLGWGKEKGV